MIDWMLENKVYAAYMLGALTATLFGFLALAEAREQADRTDDEPAEEVKHGRRRAERQPA